MMKNLLTRLLSLFLGILSLLVISCSAEIQSYEFEPPTKLPASSSDTIEGVSSSPISSTRSLNTNPQNVLPSPSATSIPAVSIQIPRELAPTIDHMIYRLAYGQYFDAYRINEPFDHEIVQFYFQEESNVESGPSNAMIASFSNFSNKIAYLTRDGTIHIYDLVTRQDQLIFTDSTGEYSVEQFGSLEFSINWSPDDLHLIIKNNQEIDSNMIYDLEEESLDSWLWDCDQVAVSPKTNNLAVWCIASSGGNKYAVMEWGGDIWVSDLAPENQIVTDSDFLNIWSFSPDGKYVAYFDPTDDNGDLLLTDNVGSVEVLLQGAAWWHNDDVEESKLPIPVIPIQWSADGNMLLVFSNGTNGARCPRWENISASVSNSYSVPCWHLINMNLGTVEWSLGDSFQDQDALYWRFDTAAISADGNYVAVTAESPGFFLTYVVDIETKDKFLWDSGASILKWQQ